ncbi:Oxygen-insensitive NAD(P)H nitroreductase / Dihydropteridine reductase [hydrothermal vent metagenome]|uniref:Oxygen-insensitive NAD(P)H nitroreductase / Dihydropteridine reductase n=1 Tax=hydrothermal vent metagenome TaxID=652676 RepID=A0A3B0X8I1_9ZZZZ
MEMQGLKETFRLVFKEKVNMKTLDAIKQRRAVKLYDSEHEMSESEIDQLMALAKLSPTAYNQQNYRFVLVRDPSLRQQIRIAAGDQPQVTDSSLLIVLCADTKAWDKKPQRYWANAPEAVQNYMVSMIDQYYRGREQVQRDEAMRSAGIAAQTIMLAAKSMGYDSCPMDGFDFDAVGNIINLPDDHVIAMFVVVGKASQPAKPRPTQLDVDEVIITDRF